MFTTLVTFLFLAAAPTALAQCGGCPMMSSAGKYCDCWCLYNYAGNADICEAPTAIIGAGCDVRGGCPVGGDPNENGSCESCSTWSDAVKEAIRELPGAGCTYDEPATCSSTSSSGTGWFGGAHIPQDDIYAQNGLRKRNYSSTRFAIQSLLNGSGSGSGSGSGASAALEDLLSESLEEDAEESYEESFLEEEDNEVNVRQLQHALYIAMEMEPHRLRHDSHAKHLLENREEHPWIDEWATLHKKSFGDGVKYLESVKDSDEGFQNSLALQVDLEAGDCGPPWLNTVEQIADSCQIGELTIKTKNPWTGKVLGWLSGCIIDFIISKAGETGLLVMKSIIGMFGSIVNFGISFYKLMACDSDGHQNGAKAVCAAIEAMCKGTDADATKDKNGDKIGCNYRRAQAAGRGKTYTAAMWKQWLCGEKEFKAGGGEGKFFSFGGGENTKFGMNFQRECAVCFRDLMDAYSEQDGFLNATLALWNSECMKKLMLRGIGIYFKMKFMKEVEQFIMLEFTGSKENKAKLAAKKLGKIAAGLTPAGMGLAMVPCLVAGIKLLVDACTEAAAATALKMQAGYYIGTNFAFEVMAQDQGGHESLFYMMFCGYRLQGTRYKGRHYKQWNAYCGLNGTDIAKHCLTNGKWNAIKALMSRGDYMNGEQECEDNEGIPFWLGCKHNGRRRQGLFQTCREYGFPDNSFRTMYLKGGSERVSWYERCRAMNQFQRINFYKQCGRAQCMWGCD